MSAQTHDKLAELGPLRLGKDTAGRVSILSLGAGALGLILTVGAMLSEELRDQALHSYLVAFLFVATLAVGSLFFVMLQHLVGAVWSVTVRRVAEIAASTLPLLALLFVPIAFQVGHLYPWAGHAAHEPLVEAKAGYLNTPFFLVRAVLYLLLWGGLGWFYYSRSVQLDASGDPLLLLRLRRLSAPAILLWAIAVTFAGFDWIMSLAPEWYSTIFGVYVFAGTMTSTLSMLVLMAVLLARQGLLREAITTEHYHDLGKLMFGFVVFWTYIAYSQFMLIWYSNIPEETRWFADRWVGSWASLSVLLIFLQFVIPFFGLLSRNAKRSPVILPVMAGILLVGHLVDLHWLVMPQLHRHGVSLHWLDVTALVGTCGLFVGVVARRMSQVPLLPVQDPFLPASLEFENA
ncbi:MAG: hypothetical protein RMK29_13475 [Myxococcales bacterium]|nr:hypothetical protein [Myxococcota bacterium]MDW8282718.1 hypothetical protein [Myxococcales bacterium]